MGLHNLKISFKKLIGAVKRCKNNDIYSLYLLLKILSPFDIKIKYVISYKLIFL